MSRKAASLTQNLILVIVSVLFAAVLAETVLRLVLPAPIIWKFPQESYVFDQEVGHWLESGQQAYTHDKAVTTNSRGLRDIEFAARAPAGVRRILALGDSQTFGNGLEQSDTWPKQLEKLLNENAGGADYEVVNSGLPASDTWQHEIILRRMLERYNPDAVILAFYVNDVVTRPDVIRFTQRNERISSSARWIYLVKRSVLVLSLKAAYDSFRHAWSPGNGFLVQNALLRGESSPVIDKQWDQVEKSLAAMRKMTDTRGIEFLVVSLPRRDQVDGRIRARNYNQRLKMIIDRNNIHYINLFVALQSAFKVHGKSLFIPWDGHNSKIANGVIADEITEVVPGLFNEFRKIP